MALLADTIHNIADAATAIPLWIAFALVRRKPTPTFTYGYGRVEDFAGIIIVLIILFSALIAGYEAIYRLINPKPVTQLGWLAIAGVIGFLGNEAVAVFRIRVGRQINSAALIEDGYHARTDGLTSLAAVLGALGVWLGYPLSDPVVGLLITLAIFGIVWQSAKAVLRRMLDGVEPDIVAELHHVCRTCTRFETYRDGSREVARSPLHGEIALALDPALSISDAHIVAEEMREHARQHLPALERLNV